jgi:hypothetical protein
MHVVRDVVASGSQAIRVELPSDATRRRACEVLRGYTLGTGHGYPAKERWYGGSIRFPTNITTTGWGLNLVQFNYMAICCGSPLGMVLEGPGDHSGASGFRVALIHMHGPCDGSNGCPGNGVASGRLRTFVIPQDRLTLGAWHDWLVHVVWSTEASEGMFEAWHRPRGGSWAQTIGPYTGYPTVQWPSGQTVHPARGTTDKQGAYGAANPNAQTVWHDNFCRGTTREVVEQCL